MAIWIAILAYSEILSMAARTQYLIRTPANLTSHWLILARVYFRAFALLMSGLMSVALANEENQ